MLTLVRLVASSLVAAVLLAGPASAHNTPAAYVRVNQVGYMAQFHKRAYVMAPKDAKGACWVVKDAHGRTVLSGKLQSRTGSWSAQFPFVYRVQLDEITRPGTYTLSVSGAVAGTSPKFRVDTPAALYSPMIADARYFFAAQRDGSDVDHSILGKKPSHLHDAHALVYDQPSYDENDELTADLVKVGGPVDALGGWWDAGDYVKFVTTTSYSLDLLLLGVRDFPDQMGAGNTTGGDFTGEAKFGVSWLMKMWDDKTRTLYYQVAIGDGDGCVTICGDHDSWRLPYGDDALKGPENRYLRNRPVLRAGPPGSPISPNLAGRTAAAYALCYENYKASDPAFANRCLLAAEHVFDLADTNPSALLASSPDDFYHEDSWTEDLELGATEIAHALARGGLPSGLPHTDPSFYLSRAAHWAHAYITGPTTGDTLNLYDTSAIAHYELYKALGNTSGLETSKAELLGDIKRELDAATTQAQADAFNAGFTWAAYDVTSHLFGLVTTASLYDELAGSGDYAGFKRRQLGAALGANAWGTSFIVGAGSTFPHCIHHQLANLVGSLTGSGQILRGAAVNGSNSADQFEDPAETPDGARPCPADGSDAFLQFSGADMSRFQDNVASWMAVEPAIDFTAAVPLALSRIVAGGR